MSPPLFLSTVGGPILPTPHLPFTIEQAEDMEHEYTTSGWCRCGHHRDDGRREQSEPRRLNRAEIRALLAEYGPAYEPKDNR